MPGDAKPELLVERFGEPLRILDPSVGFKLYPCNGFTQRPIDAALSLREQYGICAEDIERVEFTHPCFESNRMLELVERLETLPDPIEIMDIAR